MKRPAKDEKREERIQMKIVVDAYGPEEQIMGWFYYLDEHLHAPFTARCLALLSKSADAVLDALAQARTLFPFPLLGIDTDSGSEFLNEELIVYCEQEHLTFTRGRSGRKNDQSHVEQKNGT